VAFRGVVSPVFRRLFVLPGLWAFFNMALP
jgi:hypothetical protein